MTAFQLSIPNGTPDDTGIFDPGPYGNGGSGGMYDPVAWREDGYLKEINPFPANNDDNVIEDYSFEYVTRVAGDGILASSSRITNAFHYDYHGAHLYGLGGNDTIRGFGGNDILDGGDGHDFLDGGYQNDTLWGGDGNDYLIGGDGNDDMHGGKGDDYLSGGFDNDTLVGDEGADYMAGGYGDDIYVVDNEGDYVQEPDNLGDIFDKVYTTLGFYDLVAPGKGWGIDHLQYIGDGSFSGYGNELDNVIVGGRFADTLAGRDGDDRLHGGEGNDILYGDDGADTLVGETGADIMYGGRGNDVYVVDDRGDWIVEDTSELGGDADKIYTTLSSYDLNTYGRGINVEHLQYIGDGNFFGRGNELNNALVGGAGSDTLYGYGGNDWLVGGDGQDTLNGGDGNDWISGEGGADTLIGGAGDDVYVVGVGDTVIEQAVGYFTGSGIARRYVGPGVDTVETTLANYTLPENVEHLNFSDDGLDPTSHNGYGNGLDNVMRGSRGADTLFGHAGNDTLDGGAGNDIMIGGTGDDAYYVDSRDDVVSEEFISIHGFSFDAGGNDVVYTSLASYSLSDSDFSVIENLGYIGTGVFAGVGNSVGNIIHGGNGGDADNGDILLGLGGNDQLYGFGGGDLLSGGEGADGMNGGDGNDTFFMDNGSATGGDVAVGGDGFDRIVADESVAGSGLRLNLFARGTSITAEVNLVPNTSAAMEVEEVRGGGGNDWVDATRLGATESVTFRGLAGNDTLVSHGWNRFEGGAGTDTVVYSGPASNYVIRAGAAGSNSYSITNTTTGAYDLVYDVEFAQFGDGTSTALNWTNAVPQVEVADQSLRVDEWHRVGDWINVTDADGDAMTQYRFWDGGTAGSSGYFWTPDNPHHPASTSITVNAADLDNVWFRGGHTGGTETLWVQAFDGSDWSDWEPFTLTTQPNAVPQVEIADQSLRVDEWHRVGDWINVTDADGDAMTQYRLWDGGTAESSGYFWTPDNPHHSASTSITVNAADLDSVWFRGGQTGGTETLWVQAFDGSDWSDWEPFTLTTQPNAVPQVEIADQSLRVDEWHRVGDWINVTDADGDAMTRYRFWDGGTAESSGYFWTPDNPHHPASTGITVNAADLGSVWFRGGQTGGTETLWVQAFDGSDWSDWEPFTLTTVDQIVGTEGNDVLVGDAGDNSIVGLGGNDTLWGGAGADSYDGGAGDDVIFVDALDARIQGGIGFDAVYADAMTSQTGLRFTVAGSGVESVFGGNGNDIIDASGTADYNTQLFGGGGDDILIGGSNGAYTLQGGPGSDTVVFAGNQDDYTIDGSPAGWPSWMTITNNNTSAVYWLQTVERLQFDDGTIDAPLRPLDLMGTAGADVVNGSDGGVAIYGLGGDDILTGGAGNDIIDGGAGADQLRGGAGDDSFFTDGSDTSIDGGAGYDSVYIDNTEGPAGLHFSVAGTNVEFVYGGIGNDVINASGVTTGVELWGQCGDDVLTGGLGNDYLLGDEWLPGGGNDILDGGAGNDGLSGGRGNDIFVFRAGSGLDTIYDFSHDFAADGSVVAGDQDVIRFEGGLFGSYDNLINSGAMRQSGYDVIIAVDEANQITLEDVSLDSLHAGNFLFV